MTIKGFDLMIFLFNQDKNANIVTDDIGDYLQFSYPSLSEV